jgi:hypothetical protein
MERGVIGEVRRWCEAAIPDESVPLDADDLVRLLRAFVSALAIDPAIASGFTVNTIHYYRRKDIIDPPAGRTAAARYATRHLWQLAGARLAGHLGLVTLAEARNTMRSASDEALMSFLCERVADARARATVRGEGTPAPAVGAAQPVRPLPAADWTAGGRPTLIALPGDAWCLVPDSHAAHRSSGAAAALARALATALKTNRSR